MLKQIWVMVVMLRCWEKLFENNGKPWRFLEGVSWENSPEVKKKWMISVRLILKWIEMLVDTKWLPIIVTLISCKWQPLSRRLLSLTSHRLHYAFIIIIILYILTCIAPSNGVRASITIVNTLKFSKKGSDSCLL